MKGKLLLMVLIVFWLGSSFMKVQADDNLCHYSTKGKDFWFGFMQNRSDHPDHYLEITVTSGLGADLTITYGPNETHFWEGTVGANSSVTKEIPYDLLESLGSEDVEDKGIRLTSTNPVNVYALNYRTQSSDVAVIYPTESLGTSYFAMCYSPRYTSRNESNSEFLIVATEDNTTVNITPKRNTHQGEPANVSFSRTLNKGQSFQVQSSNTDASGYEDLTGSYVTSDKPIAFFSGSKATQIPFSGYSGYSYDHLFEQIPPVSTWGKEFFVVPLNGRTKDTYRVLAAENNTTVKIEGTNTIVTLSRGEFYEFELSSFQACKIISNRKILLAQYCRSQKADESNGVGDPFMIIISPVTQKINDVTFEAYESAKIKNKFYVNVITLNSEIGNITLDGSSISSYFSPFPNSVYSYAQVQIPAGTRRLLNNNVNGGFLAFVYGFGNGGDTESYGYGVGFNLDIQLEIVGNFMGDTMVVCSGIEQKLEAQGIFDSFEWSTKETGSSIMVSEEGLYSVKAFTAAGCERTAWVYVKEDDPKVDFGMDIVSCYPGEIVLDAGPGFKTYEWQDGSTSRYFTVMETGNYSVAATTELGCIATDNIHVSVFDPKFTQNYEVATDSHPDISFFNQTAHAVSYLWDFGDGTTSVEENPVHHYNQVGEYKVLLQVTSDSGCMDTTSSVVQIIPFSFYTPNAFRPDSDIPENRIFLPIQEGIDAEKYHFQVFSRLGSTVFETRNPELGWDGKSSDGSASGPGVFVWVVKFKDVQGFQHQEKGTVMLVR